MSGLDMRRPGAHRGSWMLTFADMLSIILCFLVLAYGLRAAPEGVQEQALTAIREVFRPGGNPQSGEKLQPRAQRGGNYWATWLAVRVREIPPLANNRIVAHGATASLEVSDAANSGGAGSLASNDIAALAAVLNGSGAEIIIRARAASARAADWSDAGKRAQTLSDRLVAAGLRLTPRIVVSGGGMPLAVEIGREEP